MTKPIIAIDFDDVIGDFNTPFAAYHNQNFGSKINYTDIITFDMCVVYDVDRPTFIERAKHFCHNHHDNIVPIPGAATALATLEKEYKLHIVTSRWESLRDVTEDWVNTWLPGMFTEIQFVNGHNDDKRGGKSDICHRIGAKILIDDALHHVVEAEENGIRSILVDRPWNQGPIPAGVTRVDSWEETTAWILKNIN